MEKAHLAILIKKWRAGEATVDEQRQLNEQWQRALHDESYLQSLSADERDALRSTLYRNVWQTIRQREPAPASLPAPESKRLTVWLTHRIFWRVAASLALLLVMGITLYMLANPGRFRTIRTAAGNRREVVLPDQSVVVMNGNSSIRYARTWGTQSGREVWLTGEAYFSVRHTANHQKFIVHTPDELAVEVLGTRFNVSNRQGNTRIVLQDGKVQVSDPRQQYVMKPGEVVRYSARQRKIIAEAFRPKPLLSWKDKVRVYQDVPIRTIFTELYDSHGIRVDYRNNVIADEIFNGSVPNDSLELIFEKIEKLYSVKVTYVNGVYIIE